YDTGDLFAFQTADADSLTGAMRFNGTSAGAPRTAGRIASVIAEARRLFRSSVVGRPALASGPAGVVKKGPLQDGRLDAAELVRLMHHVAVPALGPSPARFFVEGFGALDDRAMADARSVLRGGLTLAARDQEDQEYAATEQLRAVTFAGRCA